LGANDAQLDFPVVYASALNGWATLDVNVAKAASRKREDAEDAGAAAKSVPIDEAADMRPLFETIISYVPAPAGDVDAPLQFQVSALDYTSYLGRIGNRRIRRCSK
jgi:GTP-binding protein